MARVRFSTLALASILLLGGASLGTASPIGIMLVFDGGVDLGMAGPPDHDGARGPDARANLNGNGGVFTPFGVRPESHQLAWTDQGVDDQSLAGGRAQNGEGAATAMDFGDRGFGFGPESGRGDDGRGGLQLAEAITSGPGVDSLASDYFRIVGDLRPPPVFTTAPEEPPVPEPATLVMLLGGLASLAMLRRRVPARVKVRVARQA